MPSVAAQLEQARKDLLDLTKRSRLLNMKRGRRTKTVEVVDELSHEVFRILVGDGEEMFFKPVPETADDDDALDLLTLPTPQVTDSANGPAPRHVDRYLQTDIASVALQKRLLGMYYDARTFQEEQGIGVLYLALGFLKWYESDTSDQAALAPLVLIPIQLDRTDAQNPFKISYSGEDLTTNLSLKEKLRLEFGIEFPDLPDFEDDGVSLSDYFEAVEASVGSQPRWEVVSDDILLGFFSFAKFMMYRDLDPEIWPADRQLQDHTLLKGLLSDGFEPSDHLFPADERIDSHLDPAKTFHVVDADSSQAVAIEEVRSGRNLVIQGPPGTGKSQTITNLISSAVADGKTVLFVAEKRAALDVVKRRMDAIGLGSICLELHSHKAKKKVVLDELEGTVKLGRVRGDQDTDLVVQLKQKRDALNGYADALHGPLTPSGLTPFKIAGQLVRLAYNEIEPQNFTLPEAREWSRDDLRQAEQQLARLGEHVADIGTPDDHPWRGVGLDAILPNDVTRLDHRLQPLAADFHTWTQALSDLEGCLSVQCRTLGQVDDLLSLADVLLTAPDCDRSALSDGAWLESDILGDVIERGTTYEKSRSSVNRVLVPQAWDEDLADTRRALKSHGDSWFRFLISEYREAKAHLRGFAQDQVPASVAAQVALLDALQRGQEARDAIEATETTARAAFGKRWAGLESRWDELSSTHAWVATASHGLVDHPRHTLAGAGDLGRLRNVRDRVASEWKELQSTLDILFGRLSLDPAIAWGVRDHWAAEPGEVGKRLSEWSERTAELQSWITYRRYSTEARKHRLGPVVDRVADGTVDPTVAVDCFRMAFYDDLMGQIFEQRPALAQFDRKSHERLADGFRDLDRKRIKLARRQVAARHQNGVPMLGGVGEVGLLAHEFRKKRRHLALRPLLRKTGTTVQKIKPVFMMSPMSIAQYLEPGAVEFDLVVMDEASQIRPVEAMGAVARGRQLVVVGDDKQLPPTTFFDRVADGDDESDDPQVGDLESILGVTESKGVTRRRLRWHYRSEHQSLIAVSNHEFYDDELFVFPSKGDDQSLGVRFRKVEGVWERGRSRTNPIEARAVAEAVLHHAQACSNLTLGVGTFSAAQRDAILDELELLRRGRPEVERFFSTHGAEPFFVKNLESLQGDERDVIFVSVGYARDDQGFIGMNFGPVSKEGGERRLNVLMTRARKRCEVFSSITAADIDLERASARGAAVLKRFLKYAETGILDVAVVSGSDPDSVFEEQVGKALTDQGYDVAYQVGLAGFFIDLAIRDPERPGRYLIGIECDGASYHSSRAARDRDRLRQEVLEARGWTIHRIWSTDWFKAPRTALALAIDAIERQRNLEANVPAVDQSEEPATGEADHAEGVIPRDAPSAEHGAANEATAPALINEAPPYVEATFRVDSTYDPHDAPLRQRADAVAKIVEIEGPIHLSELGRRLATVWGKDRAGSRIQDATAAAAKHLVQQQQLDIDEDFVVIRGTTSFGPRSRRHVTSTMLRKAETLSHVEVRAALVEAVRNHVGIEVEELMRVVSRVFGFDRLGHDLKGSFEAQVRWLLANEVLRLRDAKLFMN